MALFAPLRGACRLLPSLCLAALLATPASAHEFKAGDLEIEHPWTRASLAGSANAPAFLTIVNDGETADRLIAAQGDLARAIELHSMATVDGVMQMRRVDAIDLPAGESVALEPGGLHIMLIGLKEPLVEGERVPLTLVFEHNGEVAVELVVEAKDAGTAGHGSAH